MPDAPAFTCTVTTRYLPEESNPAESRYAFAYTVRVVNTGGVLAQLVARHWRISDASGHTEEVRGLAVVGQQPLLRPGEAFEYTSWVLLQAPRGHMEGTYHCMSEDARAFEAAVPRFELAQPQALH